MIETGQQDLWKKAYRNQFGSDPDADLSSRREEVEKWRDHWLDAYNNREQWALRLAHGENAA